MHKVCHIVGAGEMARPFAVKEGEMVIAADGGLHHLKNYGITPDWIIGDFDSSKEKPIGENVLTFPIEKDDTDTMLAVKYGRKLGCTTFFLYGGMGGRTDHTLANIQTLCYLAERGCRGYLVGDSETITAVKNGSITFQTCGSGTLSLFSAISASKGVSVSGTKYEAQSITLKNDFPLGVSNAFAEETAAVSVEDGILVVLWEHKDGQNAVIND